jgi:asparagine synthase (glutamine-hydrolysing)
LAWYRMKQQEWYRSSAIHPDFVRRIHLLDRYWSDSQNQLGISRVEPGFFMLFGRSLSGSLHVAINAAEGIETRDPTADARLLAFTYSVPDHIYIDPNTGQDRWLIREAMKGRLPDEVRLNRRFGRQAADRVVRLRNCAAEVNSALEELACGPASTYVDIAYMRQVWQVVQNENTGASFSNSATILLRGIMAGLFVNDFYK